MPVIAALPSCSAHDHKFVTESGRDLKGTVSVCFVASMTAREET
jgi:hypothetical protein